MVSPNNCEPLPSKFSSVKPYATEYTLACVQLPKDPDDRDTSLKALAADIQNEPIMLNVESRGTPPEVTLYDAQQNDIIKNLLLDGLLTVPKRRDRRLFKLINEYRAAQDVAKNNHISIWRYGDITEDDA